MPAPPFAIAFTVREKFAWALPALRRLYKYFDVPFTLYFVDCGYPPAVRAEIEVFFSDKTNVVRIESTRFLLAGECLNLVVARFTEDYLFAINNDVLIEPGLGANLLETFRAHGCALVAPETIEIEHGRVAPHRAEYTNTAIVEENGVLRVQVPLPAGTPHPPVRQVQHFEVHALAYTRAAVLAMQPFPAICSREHIDIAVHAWRLGLTVYADDRARTAFVKPPIRDYDLPYFRFRWDRNKAREAQTYVATRWNITDFPSVMGFIDQWNAYANPDQVEVTYPDICEDDDLPPVFCN